MRYRLVTNVVRVGDRRVTSPALAEPIFNVPSFSISPVAFQSKETKDLVHYLIAVRSGSKDVSDHLQLARHYLDISDERVDASIKFTDLLASCAIREILLSSITTFATVAAKTQYCEGLLNIISERLGKTSKFAFMCNCLDKLAEKVPELKDRIFKMVKNYRNSADAGKRLSSVVVLSRLETPESLRAAWSALATEPVLNVARGVLVELSFHASKNSDWEKKYARFLAKTLDNLKHDPSIASLFVQLFVPLIKDIEKFVSRLSPETKDAIKKHASILLNGNPMDGVAYLYFKAACEGNLIKFKFAGVSFTFCTGSNEILKSPGRNNLNAIAISENLTTLPEQFRVIVAYHEYVEGQESLKGNEKAHDAAVEAEMRLVRSMDILTAYRAWIESINGAEDRF